MMSIRTIRLLFASAALLLLASWYTLAHAGGAPGLGDSLHAIVFSENATPWLVKVLTLLAAGAVWLLVRVGLSAAWRSLLTELGAHARDVVMEVWQTYVEAIKAGRADGQLTESEKARAKAMAMEKLRARLSWSKLAKLGGGLLLKLLPGSSWSTRLNQMLGGAIETAVAESKREGKAAGLRTGGTRAPAQAVPPPLPPPPLPR